MEEKTKWENKVLKSWGEYRNEKKELKSRWELVQSVEVGGKGKTRPAVQKTNFWKDENGKLVRGFAQPLNIFDVRDLIRNEKMVEILVKSFSPAGSSKNWKIEGVDVVPESQDEEYQ